MTALNDRPDPERAAESEKIGQAVAGIADRHSDTAEATAAMRAAESRLPARRRLLDDPVAPDLVRRPAYRLPARSVPIARLMLFLLERRCPGLHGHVVLRSRYADDAITRAARAGVTQVVLLGAGFDATAFRLQVSARFFDVDVPATQGVKRQRLDTARHVPKAPVAYVPCRFGVDRLGARLRQLGFDPAVPALFVWLGVVPYLTSEAFHATLADLRGISAPSAGLVLDYVEDTVLDGTSKHRGGRRVAQMVARRGEPLRTGFNPATLRQALLEHGFVVEDDAGLAELAARYPTANGPRYTNDGWNRIASATATRGEQLP